MGKRTWTEEEEKKLEEMYKEGLSLQEIADKLNKKYRSVQYKSRSMKLGDKYMRKNNTKFNALYHDYGWCYERYINCGMSHQEMAYECGATKRVIEKWCSQIHQLNNHTFRHLKKLNNMQRQVIMFGRLGDGHIDKRESQPMYIESHAEDEKDYLFWKYEILKDICNKEPTYYKESYSPFYGGKQYLCSPTYRLNTRILDDLYSIREMSRLDIIKQLNEFGFCLHILDDGNRGNLWHICLAEWTTEEKKLYIKVCKDRFNINCVLNKDTRYAYFDADSSRTIDTMILNNIPNDLDIIHKKILDNNRITKPANYIYVICDDKKYGLNTYCRSHRIVYKNAKDIMDGLKLKEIHESDFLNIMGAS